MNAPGRRRLLAALVLLAGLGPARAWPGGSPLVLVAGSQSPLTRLSTQEARKLYLGLPILLEGRAVKPLRNATDPTLTEMFMQRVMFMSTEAYERQLLTRVFRAGGTRPPVYDDPRELLQALAQSPTAITYMTRERALATPGLKIVGEP